MSEADGTLRLLTVNTGSSSVKSAVYELGPSERLVAFAAAERIGSGHSPVRVQEGERTLELDGPPPADHEEALAAFLDWLRDGSRERVDAVGHRIVHGGAALAEPTRVTPELLEALGRVVPLAPDHLPQALAAVDAVERALPDVPQVACFDTAFHRTLPRVAQLVPLDREATRDEVVRYGFHGLSYEYVVGELRRIDPATAAGRVVVAHLGNGASMAAIEGGRSVETTMGFTPAGGLPMSTRSGDLDPGVLVYLARRDGLDAGGLNDLVNRRAGLLGVSGVSSDVEELLASSDERAAEAVELFCYQARKAVGALAAVLGGLDALVFTAGIGEHGSSIRWRICEGLAHLGVQLDAEANDAGAAVVSSSSSRVTVRVMATNEDVVIARHTYDVLTRGAG